MGVNGPIVLKTDLLNTEPKRGKVRDVYDFGEYLLIVSTDRLSAFDVVFSEGIPGKGKVLNGMSAFWFKLMQDIIPNHVITTDVNQFPQKCLPYANILAGRSMLVQKAKPLPVECIVRGYLSGSGWKDYQKTGAICGIELPRGLLESVRFPEPIFTPSTKAELGTHDENINFEKACELVGKEIMLLVRNSALEIYRRAHNIALEKGIIIADTKMEFGILENGTVIIIDELLTPDSSRFWPERTYWPGEPQASYDKQFVRDHLESTGWNKKPPAPRLPEEIIQRTAEKYQQAYLKLTGRKL